tara:strand:- start:857 stop:1324 length:468 start_codon:yes stop_codon:yes gene_type:complete
MSVFLKSYKIINEWVDYNNHMNMAYYVLIFDRAWEVILAKFEMGELAAKTIKRSTMVVETNTKYISEVKEGEEVDIYLTFLDRDRKRLHIKFEMIEKKSKKIASSMEWISLYIDLEKRKVTEFENDKTQLIDKFINENKSNFNSKNLHFSSKLKK